MNVPSGYSALDLVGFTDKGDYSPSENYVKNDLVHYNDKIWKCLIDDTTGIVPTTGVNWDIWIDQSISLDGLADVEITNAQDGQEITYDSTVQKWKNTSKIQTLTNQVTGLLDNLEVNGAVNMLPNLRETVLDSGITYTVNADGSVTCNGTATANTHLEPVKTSDNYYLPKGTYKLTGCPSGGTDNTYYIRLYNLNSGAVQIGREYGDGLVFTLTGSTRIGVQVQVMSGYTANNLTFKPMITVPSYNGDYVPYAMSNRELTEEKLSLSVLKSVVADSSDFADFKTKIAAL